MQKKEEKRNKMNIFNYVKSKVDIVKVINDHIGKYKLSKSEEEPYYVAKEYCPLSNYEFDPLEPAKFFTLNTDSQLFYCTECRLGGDVIVFICHFFKKKLLSDIDGAHYLMKKYNIPEMPKESEEDKQPICSCSAVRMIKEALLLYHAKNCQGSIKDCHVCLFLLHVFNDGINDEACDSWSGK